ncbi:hypothetical protein B0T20DRAFT_448559 [Sordaria brevicollis]|uniref:NACHT domain-containing protein n=1 Tax=Sordaria brevicollis TaxID=83679 RepID=A0AAE0NVB4_SORBR|nr:hypothetical protein B0T20DRAFT_448559 [Sordaria brevicollis]
MDPLETELAIFMALQLNYDAIWSVPTIIKENPPFWKLLRRLCVLLEVHLDKTSTLFKSDLVGNDIAKLAAECLQASWNYLTDLYYDLPHQETDGLVHGSPSSSLLDTMFLLPFWLLMVEKEDPIGICLWMPHPERELKDLRTALDLLSSLISAFATRADFPSLRPANIVVKYHNSTQYHQTRNNLRMSVITTYQPREQQKAFQKQSPPCYPGTFKWALQTGDKDPRSVLSSGQTLIDWIGSDDYRQNICWISGGPGSGKSAFISYIRARAARDTHLFEGHPDHAARNAAAGLGKPIFIWFSFECYDRTTDRVSLQRQEFYMIQSILLHLYKRFSATIDRIFAEVYAKLLMQRDPDYIKAGMSTMKFRILEDTLLAFLSDNALIRPRIFILLDGPIGFSRRKTTFLATGEANSTPLIFKLKGIRNVKVLVASRPGGMFHAWGRSFHGLYEKEDQFPTLRMEDCTGEDLEIICHRHLRTKGVLLPLRRPVAEGIAKASQGCFTLIELGLCDMFREPEDTEPDNLPDWLRFIPRMHTYFESLYDDWARLPTIPSGAKYPYVEMRRMDTLSKYLRHMVAFSRYDMSRARCQRPLSLLQLTLAIDFYRNLFPPSEPLTQFQRYQLLTACDQVALTIKRDLYPIVVLKEMDDGEKPQGVEKPFVNRRNNTNLSSLGAKQEHEALIRAASAKVMFQHSYMEDYMETCHSWRYLLRLGKMEESKPRQSAAETQTTTTDKNIKGLPLLNGGWKAKEEVINPDQGECITHLLRASLFEHALLMPERLLEECEEWLEPGNNVSPGMMKPGIIMTRSRRAASVRDPTTPWVMPGPYCPFREHLRFLESLPRVEGGWEGEMLDWEFWPSTFVKQIKIEEEEEEETDWEAYSEGWETDDDDGYGDGDGGRRGGKRVRLV